MKATNIAIICFFLMVLVPGALGAFSTPYLPNNTLTLLEGEEYNFTVVFQNTQTNDTIMNLEILKGAEFFDKNTISVEVPGKSYNTRETLKISPPEFIQVGNGTEALKLDWPYEVEYTVSSGDKGGEGIVPVTSQVKKKFNIIWRSPQPELTSGNQTNIIGFIIVGVVIFGALVYFYVDRKKQKKMSNENQGNTQSGQDKI